MKREDIKLGETYEVKVSGKLAPVRIVGDNGMRTSRGREIHAGWVGLNVKTKRRVDIRGSARIRKVWREPRCGKCPNCLTLIAERPDWIELYRGAKDNDVAMALRLRKGWKDRTAALACTTLEEK